MKKLFLALSVAAILLGTITSSFGQTPDKDAEKARENLKKERKDVVEAKQDLMIAQQDSISEYQKLTNISEIKFKDNEKMITDLRTRIVKNNSKNKAADQKKINLLEQDNNNLKKELADYKIDGQKAFPAFKNEFNRDLDKVTRELRDFKIV